MKNRTLVAILIIVAAVLSLFWALLESGKKYEADMNVAVTTYITQNGHAKRKDRLVVNYIKADPHCNFSLNDIEWQRLKVHFGIPEFNGYLFKHFKSQKELKHGGKNPKTVDC